MRLPCDQVPLLMCKHEAVFKALVAMRADVNLAVTMADGSTTTLLAQAIDLRQTQTMRWLLDANADPNLGADKHTPLDRALIRNHAAISLLLERKADVARVSTAILSSFVRHLFCSRCR